MSSASRTSIAIALMLLLVAPLPAVVALDAPSAPIAPVEAQGPASRMLAIEPMQGEVRVFSPLARKDVEAMRVSSADDLALLESAADAARLAVSVGLDPALPPLVLPGDLVIDRDLDIPLLNVTIVGDVVITNNATVRLFGASLRIRDLYTPFVDTSNLPPPVANQSDHSATGLTIEQSASLELWNLHAFDPLGSGVVRVLFADAPSLLGSDAGVTTPPDPIFGLGGVPGARLRIDAAPGTRFVMQKSILRDVESGLFLGMLDVEDSRIETAYTPFTTTDPDGPQAILRSDFRDVAYAYIGERLVAPRFDGNDVLDPWIAVQLSDAPGASVRSNLIEQSRYGAIQVYDSPGANVDNNTITRFSMWYLSQGIAVSNGANSSVSGNRVAQGWAAINVASSPDSVVDDNVVADVVYGLTLYGNDRIAVRGNDVSASWYAITLSVTHGVLTGNLARQANWCIDVGASDVDIADNEATTCVNAFTVTGSPTLVHDNFAHDNTGYGFAIVSPAGNQAAIFGNRALRNGFGAPGLLRGGIELHFVSAARFERNVMEDNAFGLSIPYNSKETLRVARDNWVNGFNVDGTVVAGDRLYWLGGMGCEAGLTVNDRTIDVTNGGAFVGALNAQGIVTAYDCGPVVVDRADIPLNTHGVFVWNAPSLRVRNGTFLDNDVRYQAGINAPNDPYIRSGAIFVDGVIDLLVRDNDIAGAEVGILERASEGDVTANEVSACSEGILSAGSATRITSDHVAECEIGIHVVNGGNLVARNRVGGSVNAGLRLDLASPDVTDNEIVGRGTGVTWEGSNVGIDLYTSSPFVRGGSVREVNIGVQTLSSGPTLDALLVEGAGYGFSFHTGSAPTVQGGTLVRNASIGLYLTNSGLTMSDTRFNVTNGMLVTTGSFNLLRVAFEGHAEGTGFSSSGASGTLERVAIRGFQAGVDSTGSSVLCKRCDLVENEQAARVANAGSFSMQDSIVASNELGIVVRGGTVVTLLTSNFEDNTQYAVLNEDPTINVQARNNWWNSATGAATIGPDSVQGLVTKTPFLTAPNGGAGSGL
ncbi:MAG TPA: right-handed parallel beta-helix repeat-containing protein [Candidatus Thermoplasmatota archaeon]|nr:right-handed parallel beta-helix repeat-containing protein [Candidatus Thermoplasmatota archaeon]